jgi:hypothetical protein
LTKEDGIYAENGGVKAPSEDWTKRALVELTMPSVIIGGNGAIMAGARVADKVGVTRAAGEAAPKVESALEAEVVMAAARV